jgi:hypothetical protein
VWAWSHPLWVPRLAASSLAPIQAHMCLGLELESRPGTGAARTLPPPGHQPLGGPRATRQRQPPRTPNPPSESSLTDRKPLMAGMGLGNRNSGRPGAMLRPETPGRSVHQAGKLDRIATNAPQRRDEPSTQMELVSLD